MRSHVWPFRLEDDMFLWLGLNGCFSVVGARMGAVTATSSAGGRAEMFKGAGLCGDLRSSRCCCRCRGRSPARRGMNVGSASSRCSLDVHLSPPYSPEAGAPAQLPGLALGSGCFR